MFLFFRLFSEIIFTFLYFQDQFHSWSGGFDQQVKIFDFNTNTETIVGSHSAPIRCVEYSPDVNAIITGGWDSCIKLWDSRAPNASGSFAQPDKVYTLAVCGETLVVGTAGRRVLVWDLRNMSYVQQRRESSLKYQTRCIKCFPNKQGYVLSSIEKAEFQLNTLIQALNSRKKSMHSNATGPKIQIPV